MSDPKEKPIHRSRTRLYEALPEKEEKAIRTVVEARSVQQSGSKNPGAAKRSVMMGHQPISKAAMEVEAEQLVEKYMYGAMGRGLLPIPIVDLVAVTRHQLNMLRELSDIYELAFDEKKSRSMLDYLLEGNNLLTLGGSIGGSLLKSIPVLGPILGAGPVSLMAGSSTWYIGRAFIHYYQSVADEDEMNMEELKKVFELEKQKNPALKDGW